MTHSLIPELNNFKAFLFDLDATLIDSNPIWQEVDEMLWKILGLSESPIDFHDPTYHGMSFNEINKMLIEVSGSDLTCEQIAEKQEEYLKTGYAQVSMTHMALEFIKAAKKAGIKIGICTSSSRNLLNSFLLAKAEEEGIHFDFSVTSDEAGAGKPNPAVYLKGIEMAGFVPEQCAAFEDSLSGLKAAVASGCTSFAVPYGINTEETKLEIKKTAYRWLDNGFADLLMPSDVRLIPQN